MPDYKTESDDPKVIAAQVDQVATDYPDLDYLLCFQSENMPQKPNCGKNGAMSSTGCTRV